MHGPPSKQDDTRRPWGVAVNATQTIRKQYVNEGLQQTNRSAQIQTSMAIVVSGAGQRHYRAVSCARTNSYWFAHLLRSSHPGMGCPLGGDGMVYSRLVTRNDMAVLTGIGKKHAIAVGDELWTRYVALRCLWPHGMQCMCSSMALV